MVVILLILAFIGGFVYCCFAKSLKKFAIRFAVFFYNIFWRNDSYFGSFSLLWIQKRKNKYL